MPEAGTHPGFIYVSLIRTVPEITPFSSTSMFSAAGTFGKAGMAIISPGERDHEARARAQTRVAHIEREALGRAQLAHIVGQ